MPDRHTGRRAVETIDQGGLYFSRLVSGGAFAFVGGVAVDSTGSLAPQALVHPPFALSPAAHVTSQTSFIFQRFKEALSAVGSNLDNLVQVEQWIPHKVYADGYLETSHGSGFIERNRPTSALLWTGDLVPATSTVTPMGIAVIPAADVVKEIRPPSEGFLPGMTKAEFGETFAEEGPFNEVITAGPLVFIVGDIAQSWESGDIESGVKLPEYTWWGSAIRNESTFLLHRLEQYLARAGSTLQDVVHTTVYLSDIADIFELEKVWRRVFPERPPARSVVPVPGFGVPRREAAGLQHRDGAVQMEHLSIAARPDHGGRKEVIVAPVPGSLHQSEAVRAGQLLWISAQTAGVHGLESAADADSQIEYIFERLAELCLAAGTTLSNMVRLRGFVINRDDAFAIYRCLRRHVPVEPPTVGITTVPGPLLVPGCTVMLDAIAYIPG